MESKKVKEIKKGLECCCHNCTNCPYDHYDKGLTCADDLTHDALTLINELESENEMLLNEKWDKEDDLDNYHIENQELKDRIAEMEKKNKENTSYAKGYADGIKNTYEVVMPDKLKQIVQRLKSKDCSVPIHTGIILIEDHVLEETLKEFIENER